MTDEWKTLVCGIVVPLAKASRRKLQTLANVGRSIERARKSSLLRPIPALVFCEDADHAAATFDDGKRYLTANARGDIDRILDGARRVNFSNGAHWRVVNMKDQRPSNFHGYTAECHRIKS